MTRLGYVQVQKRFLLALVVFISLLFLYMIRSFLITLFLAAVLSGLGHPLYRRILGRFGGRRSLASATTLLVFVLVVLIPILSLLVVVATQALQLTQTVSPIVERLVSEPDVIAEKLRSLPVYQYLEPYRDQILTKVGEIVQYIGRFVFRGLSGATRGTLLFFFHLFLLLYAMFFFLKDGREMLRRILHYIPLRDEEETLMVDRFVSVTRATLKGTVVIGIVQGGLAGAAFAVAGIGNAVFWGAVMAVLSIIPGIGAGLVWLPAAIFLVISGRTGAGVALGVFCAMVVGSADNFLRPRLVGKDARISDLLILLSTLGGILLFGLTGFIIGPIVAALFVTVWEIYGTVFGESLPEARDPGS